MPLPAQLPEQLYTTALRSIRPLLPLVASGDSKLARGVRGRQEATERLERWGFQKRERERPLVWFHAPSVGEGLQARAVMECLRARRPDVQIAYTFFSPSAEKFARTVPADVADYLPLDLPAEQDRLLDALRPDVVVFTKSEVWPNLSRRAAQRGVRLALLSATLPPTSSRLSRAARALLTPAYERLDRVATISAADAERYELLGVPAERRVVMGDARFDQVTERAARADRDSALLGPLRTEDRITIVAGSTWPEDETRLFAAFRDLRDAGLPVRLIIAPHEPTRSYMAGIEARLEYVGLNHIGMFDVAADWPHRPEVLTVDRLGVLGDLYAVADVAYVGGGFGTAGLHSVLEPAAYGVPVLFGPNHANAREAGELAECGGGSSTPNGAALRDRLRTLLQDSTARRAAGAAAQAYVESGRGAAERGADTVEELLAAVP